MNGKETYKKIAESLPWEIQSALLAIRDAEEDPIKIEHIYQEMPPVIYIAMIELCLITEWSEAKLTGMKLTSAGKHLVEFCSC